MSQKPPEKSFEWIEDTSQFNEDFIKIYNEQYFNKLMINISKNYMNFIMIYHFCLRTWRLKIHDKTEYVIHIRNLEKVLNYGFFFEKTSKID